MIRVRCQQHVTIDAKGRLALPAPIRRAIEEMGQSSLVLTFSRGAVWAWTAEHYEAEVERHMIRQDPFQADVMDFAHSTMSTAQDCEIDKQGRIRIPAPLRSLAGLTRECVVHVLLGHVEIWDRTTWDERFEESLTRTAARSGMPGRQE